VSVDILDQQFHPLWNQKRQMDVPPRPSAKGLAMGEFTIPDSLEDKFFFVVAEARQADGGLLSRSVYWPRCLKLMSDPDFRAKCRGSPPALTELWTGPWLRPQVAVVRTSLDLMVISRKDVSDSESAVRVRVRSTGASPAFDARVGIAGTKRAFYSTDNDLWLMPGEPRTMDFKVLSRDPSTRASALATAGAWNAELRQVPMPAPR
jgi:beta-mannosidase